MNKLKSPGDSTQTDKISGQTNELCISFLIKKKR